MFIYTPKSKIIKVDSTSLQIIIQEHNYTKSWFFFGS